MSRTIRAEPLTHTAFAPFGDVIDMNNDEPVLINGGRCQRFNDLARLSFDAGRAGISLFYSQPITLPLKLDLVERHPLGSQAFLPMSSTPFLVVVGNDRAGRPKDLRAFVTQPGQGVNYLNGVWHGVLMPIGEPSMFAVVDRIGPGSNLEEHPLIEPCEILA